MSATCLSRRSALRWGCAHCLAAGGLSGLGSAWAQSAPAPGEPGWQPPARFTRPDLASDEGGMWAMMDREETRMRRSPLRVRDEALNGYVTQLTTKLAGAHAPDVRVHVMRMPLFNASMAPNGMMVLWSGLLLRMENEAQLASVLGHEIGHYLQRHALQRMQDARARGGANLVMAMFGIVGLIGQLAIAAGGAGFSRDNEREADRIGVALLRQHGYDTRQAGLIWGAMLAEVRATPGNEPTKESALFASHPPSHEREAELGKLTSTDTAGATNEGAWRRIVRPLRPMLLDDELKRAHPHETIALMDRLLIREPGDGWLLATRGEAKRQRAGDGDLNNALDDFVAAIASADVPATAYRGIGDTQHALGRKDEAREAWKTYLNRAPDAADAALVRQQLETLT